MSQASDKKSRRSVPSVKTILGKKYILASESPRRIQLLEMLGLDFRAISSGVAEIDSSHNPVNTVRRNALSKSRHVAYSCSREIVIGADTIVVLGSKTLNKPASSREAVNYLIELSGRRHTVYTGVNVINTSNGKEVFGYEKTSVYFRELTHDEIKYYVSTHKPLDKAGAYGIQDDFGSLFISKINGDYYNIVGLPLVKLYECIREVI